MQLADDVLAVVTADIIESTAYSARDRQVVDKILRAAFDDAVERFPGAFASRLAFRITAGDEFQVVIKEVDRTFQILTYLRAVAASGRVQPFIRFRASIGVGPASIANRVMPYENDGIAFVRSRRGLDQLTEDRTPLLWTKIRSGRADQDVAFDGVLAALDFMQQSWTARQWEAVRWSLLGAKREESAKKLKIRHQNVSKRLKAAGWTHFEIAGDSLELMLSKLSTPKRVQKRNAS